MSDDRGRIWAREPDDDGESQTAGAEQPDVTTAEVQDRLYADPVRHAAAVIRDGGESRRAGTRSLAERIDRDLRKLADRLVKEAVLARAQAEVARARAALKGGDDD